MLSLHESEQSTPVSYRIARLGVDVEAIRRSGRNYIVIRSVCVPFVLEDRDQTEWLREQPWTEVTTVTIGGRGTLESVNVIPLQHLYMWLALLDATKVHPEMRTGLMRLQEEAAEFLGMTMN